MAIYCKYAAIDGDVTATGHEKWIQLESFQWGVGRAITAPNVGATTNREGGTPSVSEIVVTKDTDVATIKLLNEALQGKGEDCTIDFCKTESGNPAPYLTYVLNNTLLSGFSNSSAGDRPTESLSLNFTKIMCTDVELGASAADGQPATVGYDLALAKVL